jgi:fumarate hydratase class II
VNRSLMLVTALAPVIGYDKASKIAHHAAEHDLTLRDPAKTVKPYVAAAACSTSMHASAGADFCTCREGQPRG